MKRFRVIKYDGEVLLKADTTKEIFEFLDNTAGEGSFIEDLEDDITISEDEFMEAFREGECPGDLQFF